MDDFIAQQNVARFRHELENGADGERRSILLRLLVVEEDKFGLTEEQLNEMDRQIARLKSLVTTQLEMIAAMKAHGQSLELAERSLHNILDVLIVHQARRAKIELALPIGAVPKQRPGMS